MIVRNMGLFMPFNVDLPSLVHSDDFHLASFGANLKASGNFDKFKPRRIKLQL